MLVIANPALSDGTKQSLDELLIASSKKRSLQ